MFSRKNHSPTPHPQSPPSSPLPQLQQLVELESQLISILDKRNILVDESADIFKRLQELYLNSLQGTPLGMDTLQKCLRVLGRCDSPARVRFLYLCAHEMVLKGAAADQVETVLLEAFHSGIALKHKVDLGFKAGLAFCQVSEHFVKVDKILSNLIVALEKQLGYKPQRKAKAQHAKISKNSPVMTLSSMQQTKAIYLGRSTHKPASKTHPHGRAQRLELFKLLFEGFVTGSWRVQSQAKRRYYEQCKEELRWSLIREYPGREMEKKLTLIEEKKSISLLQLGSIINWNTVFASLIVQERSSNTQCLSRPHSLSKQSHEIHVRSKSQATNSAGFQSMKNSSVKDPQATWDNSTPIRQKSFKLHIRRNSKHRIQSKKQTERQDPIPQQKELVSQQVNILVSRLVFKQNNDNVRLPSSKEKQQQQKKSSQPTKGIVLKFDRLNQQKIEMRKKKLKCSFTWQKDKQKGHKQNNQQHVPHVVDIQLLPQIAAQAHPISPRQQIQAQLINFTLKEVQNQQEQQHSITNHSISELNSARRIDQMLKEGVQWISHLEDEPGRAVVSNVTLSQCQTLAPARHEQSFSDTYLINQSIQEEPDEILKDYSSYKIVIRPLEKPQVNLIISEEVQAFLKRINELSIEKQFTKELSLKYLKDKIKKYSKKQPKQKVFEVSIVRKESNDDSQCDKVEVSSKLQEIQLQEQGKSQQQVLGQISSDMMMPANEIIRHLQEQKISKSEDEAKGEDDLFVIPEVKVEYADNYSQAQKLQMLKMEVSQWLSQIQEEIMQNLQQQPQQVQLPKIPLSNMKCSISPQKISSSSSSSRQPQPPFQTDSIDDQQLSSQIKSCPSIQENPDQSPLQPLQRPFNRLHAPIPQQRQGSLFTCSRFGGSKIDTEKQSDFEWRSQMNFMNKIFKNDRISQKDDLLPMLQIPQNRRDNRCIHLEQSSQGQNENRSNYRSRVQSQLSNKSSKSSKKMKESSSRSLPKEKAHVCHQFSYTDNYESVAHTCKKFNHWLFPELRVNNHRLLFAISNNKREKVKEVVLPAFIGVNDDTIRKVSKKLESFINEFSEKRDLNEQQWVSLGKEVDKADFLPDEAELPSISIQRQAQEEEMRCVANLKSLRIVLQSTKMFLKINPIASNSLQELETAVSSLDASKFFIKPTEILIKGMWTFTGNRNIKLRQKSQVSVSHLVFDVLEKYNENGTFDYCIKEQCGERLYFQGVELARRPRILKNMDTIIGFCLKSIQGKPKFINQNLKQFLTLF